jgi:signal transduction histidine kinase
MLDPDRRHLTTYNHSASDTASIVGDIVSVVKEDSRGNLWICTPRGLSRFVRGKPDYFRNYLHTAKEASPWGGNDVTDIVEDRSSDIWVTMRGRGLNKFDREHDRFVRFAYPGDSTGERENWMNRVCEDRRGILWMPTNGGLVLFDPRSNRFSPFESNFLQRTFVFDIVADNSEHMWLATGFGLLRLTPATGMVVRYDRTHGFTFNELTSEFFPTPRGGLYVGGLDGFAEFAPDSMVESKRVPSIAITEFTIFGKPQPLDYVNPSLNRFAYRMEGLDADWIDAGTRHHVSYTNLTPGDYVFRVKGTNSDGVWNDPGILVRVAIAPPYWRTWWFALLTAAIAAASVTTVYRYRVGKLLEMQRIRLRIASDLHDDVGSNLGAIAFASKTLQNTPDLSPATRLRLTSIYDLAVKTSEGMRDIVWFITPERDNIDDLVLHMKDAATSVLGPIEHRFEDRSGSADVHLSLEFRRKVFLAFKETLANVVKHAGATRVDIEVSRENGMLVVSVRDNGKGFDEQTARKGNGLANLRSRARSAGGDCTITSAAAKGTTVKFTAALET